MTLFPLYLINFINALGFSIVVPYLVFWAMDFGGSEALYGFLGATYAAFQLIGAPLLGSASDKYGRKKLLILSQAGTLFSWIVILTALYSPLTEFFELTSETFGKVTFTLPLLLLILARAFDGLTAGNISIANAYLSDVSSPEKRSENFGRMSAASSLGFILGPAVAGVVGSDVIAVYVAIIISLLCLICIQFLLKESIPQSLLNNPCHSEVKRLSGAEIRDCNDKTSHKLEAFLHRKPILKLFILYFIIYLGFNIFYSTFPLMAKNVLQWDPKKLGYFFSVMGGCLVLVQSFLLPKANKIFNETQLIILGSALLACSKILLTFESQFIWFVPILFSLGNGLMWPSFLTVLSSQGRPDEQGSIQGYGSSFGSMASICGLLGGSFLFAQFGSTIFVVASILFIFVALLGFSVKPQPQS